MTIYTFIQRLINFYYTVVVARRKIIQGIPITRNRVQFRLYNTRLTYAVYSPRRPSPLIPPMGQYILGLKLSVDRFIELARTTAAEPFMTIL